MATMKNIIRNTPIVREIFSFAYRFVIALSYFKDPFGEFLLWLFRSKELANFTYDLTDQNKHYLASMIANITGFSYKEIELYIDELESDENLRNHIRESILASGEAHFADLDVHYGRRLGWYAFVRVLKPKTVVETGVDKGMGSCVLTAALIKNGQEGFPGYYFGTDINPRAGYMFTGKYADFGEILYGDSIESLMKFEKTIDLFINDSDHSADYERREYQTIAEKLSPHAIVLGDNAHITDKLLNFAHSTGRQFVFFHEKPANHWYPGAGIGIAYQNSSNAK